MIATLPPPLPPTGPSPAPLPDASHLPAAAVGQSLAIGLVAGFAAALLGGSWQVVTRMATMGSIAPQDLVIFRYFIPAALLLPVLLKVGLWPQGVGKGLLLLMVCGAGLPFGLAAMTGSQFAPAAHMGVFTAGAAPLFAGALAWALWHERPSAARLWGWACMAFGVAALGAKAMGGTTHASGGSGVGQTALLGSVLHGDALFLLAALLWAGFTLSFRRTGLTPWQGAALVNGWSALLMLPWLAWRFAAGEPSNVWLPNFARLAAAGAADLVFHALFQGVLAGVLGLWTFVVAIRHLGAARAAAWGAMAPVVSAVGGWWLLGDALGALEWLAVFSAVLGVALASGAVGLRKNG